MKNFTNRAMKAIRNKTIVLTLTAAMLLTNITGIISYADAATISAPNVTVGTVYVDLALDGNLMSSQVPFSGGDITSATAPTSNNARFLGAYVWLGGDKTKTVPIKYVTASSGEVYYKVDSKGQDQVNSDSNVGVLYAKGTNDKIVFQYASSTASTTKYSVTYSMGSSPVSNNATLGGNAKLVSGDTSIPLGGTGYFQVVRTSGTTLSVTASNGTVTKVSTSRNGFVETYKLTGVSANTTVSIKENWKQTSYNIKYSISTSALSTASAAFAAGRLITKAAQTATGTVGSTSTESKAIIVYEYAGNKAAQQFGWSGTVTHNSDLSKNSLIFYYVANKLATTGSPRTHQNLASIVIKSTETDGESIVLPTVKGGTATTTLMLGEKAGTVVKVEWWGEETAADSVKIPVYNITFNYIHTDLNISLKYVDSRYKTVSNQGSSLGVEVIKSVDGGNKSYFVDGTTVTSSTDNVQLLFKASAGYYNPKIAIATGTISKTYDPTTWQDYDGYKMYNMSDVGINTTPVAVATVTSDAISYNASYNANGGTYESGTPGVVTYKVNNDGGANSSSVILVNSSKPTRDNYTFTGYKIQGDSKGTVYQPGDTIDLNYASVINLPDFAVDSNGKANIVFVAQWKGPHITSAETTKVIVTEKKPDADNPGSYIDVVSKFVAPVGVKYMVVGYTDSTGTLACIEADGLTGTTNKAESDNSATVTYGKNVAVTYTKEDATIKGNMPSNITDKYAYEEVTLATTANKLTKDTQVVSKAQEGAAYYSSQYKAMVAKYITIITSYEHIGWTDTNTGTTYQFGETVRLPLTGLNLVPEFQSTTGQQVSYATLAANDFKMPIALAKSVENQTIDPNSDLGRQIISLASAQGFIANGAPDSSERVSDAIVKITHTVSGAGGTYDLSFTSAQGLTRKVQVTVGTGKITANDLSLTIDEARNLIQSDASLIKAANVAAYDEDGREVSVIVKVNNVRAESGEYAVVFEANNTNKTTVAITVRVANEVIKANDFEVTADVAKTLTDAQIIYLAGAKAYTSSALTGTTAVKVKESTISPVAGSYRVTFTTDNGTTKSINVTVIGTVTAETPSTPADTTTKPDTTTPSGSGAAGSTTVAEQSVLNRYAGANRTETSIKVAEAMKENANSKFNNIIVASANSFADALAGSYLSYITDAPILTVNDTFRDTVAAYVKNNLAAGGKVYLLGGTGAVSQEFEYALLTGSGAISTTQIERLAGANRYLTNIEILKKSYQLAAGTSKASTTILICAGNEYADSLAASATKMPILLVDKAMVNGAYLKGDQITYLATSTLKDAIVVGGTGAVLPAVENELKLLLGKTSIERISGSNRYETSVKIAERFFKASDVNSVTFAYGLDFPDGLAAGPLAIKNNSPLILIAGTTADIVNNPNFFLTDSRARYAKSYVSAFSGKVMKYSVIGGTGVISTLLASQLTGVNE
jgi:putative cell wall-binding protein